MGCKQQQMVMVMVENRFYVERKKKKENLVEEEVLVKIWFRDQAVPELIPLSSYQSQYLH